MRSRRGVAGNDRNLGLRGEHKIFCFIRGEMRRAETSDRAFDRAGAAFRLRLSGGGEHNPRDGHRSVDSRRSAAGDEMKETGESVNIRAVGLFPINP